MLQLPQNLIILRKYLGFKVSDFAEKLGIQYRTYQSYERGERKPPLELLEQLVYKYGVNMNWLLTDEGEMFSSSAQSNSDCYEIPVLGDVKASMGYGVTVFEQNRTGIYPVSRQLAEDLNLNIKKTEMIFASGDSMAPTIEGGDSLLIDRSKTEIHDGKIYCVRINGELYAKRLQFVPPSIVVVISDNRKYKSFDVDLSKEINYDFEIIGEVRWWGRVSR